jgi:Preprotein translocase subunit SecA (ATPase, RNA helicase)
MNLDNYVTNKKLSKIAAKIVRNTAGMQSYSDNELRTQYGELKQSFDPSKHPLDYSMKIFAIVYELVRRKLGIHTRLEQLVCAMALSEGYFVEMKTGEGKTISAVFAGALLSLYDRVHIVTINDYLAGRDYALAKIIYESLGINVSVILESGGFLDKTAYMASIIYSSGQVLAFDFLREGYFDNDKTIFSSPPIAIVDEVDFVLIDNANSSFSVCMEGNGANRKQGFYKTIKEFANSLIGQEIMNEDYRTRYDVPDTIDYVFNKAYDQLYLTDLCLRKLENIFNVDWSNESKLNNYYFSLIDTLKAKHFLLINEDYIIDNQRIVLINRTNGRLMPNAHLNFGLQAALEIKEGLMISDHGSKENRISYQMLFSKFHHLCGLSGTLNGVEEELYSIFKRPTIRIREHRKNIRKERPDTFFRTDNERLSGIDEIIRNNSEKKRPILIVCQSERQAYQTFEHLRYNEGARLLISRTTNDEDQIIKEAGTIGSLLITTNMASRGTDIIITDDSEKVGGLLVLCLGHFNYQRMDEQIRGRAGRQGASGECMFMCSLEDIMWKYLTANELTRVSECLRSNHKNRSNKYLSERLAKIQLEIEGTYRSTRKFVYMVDSILDAQKLYLSRIPLAIQTDVTNFVSSYLKKLTTRLYGNPSSQRVLTLFGIEVNTVDVSQEECLQLYQSLFRTKIHELTEALSAEILKALISHQIIDVWPAYCEDAEKIAQSAPRGCGFSRERLVYEYNISMRSYFENFILSILLSQFTIFLDIRENTQEGLSATSCKYSA